MPFSRRWVIRSSMAAITCGTHWPFGSSAVRHACISTDLVPASDNDAATTSPAEFRPRAVPVPAGGGPPARGAGAGGEEDRTDDGVRQRLLVAVRVVGAADQAALAFEAVLLVPDEGDALVRLGAERRPGQAEPAGRAPERLLRCLAPGEAVTGVVHLVE